MDHTETVMRLFTYARPDPLGYLKKLETRLAGLQRDLENIIKSEARARKSGRHRLMSATKTLRERAALSYVRLESKYNKLLAEFEPD